MEYVISEFKPMGGKHCITNALKQVFEYYQIPMTEAMLFGMGTALGFACINLAHSPMISGRSKPIEFEQKLAERLQIEINCRQPKKCGYRLCKSEEAASTKPTSHGLCGYALFEVFRNEFGESLWRPCGGAIWLR